MTASGRGCTPPHTASHLLELLGFDLHLLLQGRVCAPELHGLLVAEQHLLLHFPFTAFLGQGRAQGLSGPACPREGQGSSGYKLTLPITGSSSTVATDTGKEKKASHGPWPLLLPVSGASLNLLLSSCSHVCAIHCPLGMETPARRAGPFQEYQAKIDSHHTGFPAALPSPHMASQMTGRTNKLWFLKIQDIVIRLAQNSHLCGRPGEPPAMESHHFLSPLSWRCP